MIKMYPRWRSAIRQSATCSLLRCLTAGIEIFPLRRNKEFWPKAVQLSLSVNTMTFPPAEVWAIQANRSHPTVDSWSKPHRLSLWWCGVINPRPPTPDPPPPRGGCGHLECGHTDDVGLGVVGGAGWIVAIGRGARRRGHADDGGGGVALLTVQRNRLLKLGVQTRSTGTTAEKKETEETSV